MKTFYQLSPHQKRRHLQLLRFILHRGRCSFFRGESSFRMVERLHRAGLVTACISKWKWASGGKYAFRELAVFVSESEAKAQYSKILPRR